MSERRAYPTDLSDAEWAVLIPLLPPRYRLGRPRGADLREVINALYYMDRNGCAWRALPHDSPSGRPCGTTSTPGAATAPGNG